MDREKVITALEFCTDIKPVETCFGKCPYAVADDDYRCRDMKLDALDLLKEQEAEGKWIYGENETGVDGWHCSECGFFEPWFYEFTDDIDFIRFYGFCPNCGRKMTSYTGKLMQENQ